MIVKIPEDIRIYQVKLFGSFTTRQAVCLALGSILIFPSYFLLYKLCGDVTLAGIISAIVGMPVIFCGFMQKDGVFLDKMLKAKWEKTHNYKTKRPFIMRNLYEDIQLIEKEDLLSYEDDTPKPQEANSKHKSNSDALEKKKHSSGKYSLRNNNR